MGNLNNHKGLYAKHKCVFCGGCLCSLFSTYPVILFILCLGIVSCVKDDRSDCPDQTTLTILFEYMLPNGKDAFADNVDNVDLYIFDANKKLYTALAIGSDDLEQFQGITLTLDAADYYLVAWANTQHGIDPGNGADYKNMQLMHDRAAATTGRLHYAPDQRDATGDGDFEFTPVTVIENKNNVHVLPFMGAYHTVEVYIRGVRLPYEAGASVTGLAHGYDYGLNLIGSADLVFTTAAGPVTIEDEPMLMASFHIPHFTEQEPVYVHAHTGQGTDPYVLLQQYIEKNEIKVTHGNPATIPILFDYLDGVFVQVKFPEWLRHDVIGGV